MKISKMVFLAAAAGCASLAMAEPVASRPSGGGSLTAPRAVLWNQAIVDNSYAIVDQEFGDFGAYSTYLVDDFTTGGQTWNVSGITTYYTKGFGLWGSGISTGSLNFYAKGGSLPGGGDAAPEHEVAVTVTDIGGYWMVQADTSAIGEMQGINGDFWVGLTPHADFGSWGQEFHVGFQGTGDHAAMRNPGGGFGFSSTDWQRDIVGGQNMNEMAFVVTGDVVPAPASLALVGIGGLAATRRRR